MDAMRLNGKGMGKAAKLYAALYGLELDEATGELLPAGTLAKRKEDARVKEVTSMDLPLDWNNVFDGDERSQGVHADTPSDGLILSLSNLGKVDIEYIASITNKTYKEVISSLKGAIYQNPLTWEECFYKGWESAEEYLSGNLLRKRKAAEEANKKYNGYFEDNLKAIDKLLPPSLDINDIYITLGSPWVPADIIDDFMIHVFDKEGRVNGYSFNRNGVYAVYKTLHDEQRGTWEIPYKSRYNNDVKVTSSYGTHRMQGPEILERTLNMKSIVVYDEIKTYKGNKKVIKRIINKNETIAAVEKQKKLIDEFQRWVWLDPKRKQRLTSIFEERFACVLKRNFDGSFLSFPTMNKEVTLFPYQKDAVARIIFTPNTLLAHDVGSGKTYVMIAAGQEMRRMGLSKKNMYVVPNDILGQWKSIYLSMYPEAKLLVVSPKEFVPASRQAILKRMKEEDFDAIILPYSCFERIPLSKSYRLEQKEKRLEEVEESLKKKIALSSRLRREKKQLVKEIADLRYGSSLEGEEIYFDSLGINRLFIDEAHNFKNVPLETKTSNVLGINSVGSKRCLEMMEKVHMIQKKNDGKGVVLATGTPITNSITDAYIMQSYLQSGELAMLDLSSFDAWIGMFAEKSTQFEIDVDTSSYRLTTRFSRFHNLPELTSLLAQIADFHQTENPSCLPSHDGYLDSLLKKTHPFVSYLSEISTRADKVRKHLVSPKEDNMLKITTDGRKAALDLRLVDEKAYFSTEGKVASCASNVSSIYFAYSSSKATQLIFCDTSTPKAGFNIYDELKRLLVLKGVKEEEIAYIHDATTERKREALFAKVRKGEIRVLIGSTFKLGLGVNVQNKLIALHHLDIPWRPADMTQREGRILRPGNTNKKVYLYRYITEGSFDAYSWQLLETKQRFIADLLSGSLSLRSGSDIEDTVLSYAEVKALAVGNPLVKKRVETANELSRLRTLQRKAFETHAALQKEAEQLPSKILDTKKLIEETEKDVAAYETWKTENPRLYEGKRTKKEDEDRKALRDLLAKSLEGNFMQSQEKKLATYRGFSLLLPAHMMKEHPYVWLEKEARHRVELGLLEKGLLVRIDNYIDALPKKLKDLQEDLKKSRNRQASLKVELEKKEDYTEQIDEVQLELERLDKKLGVNKNE